MRKRSDFLILSLLLALSGFGVARGEDYIISVFSGNIEEKDDNVYIIDFGESLKLAKIVKGVDVSRQQKWHRMRHLVRGEVQVFSCMQEKT